MTGAQVAVGVVGSLSLAEKGTLDFVVIVVDGRVVRILVTEMVVNSRPGESWSFKKQRVVTHMGIRVEILQVMIIVTSRVPTTAIVCHD